MMGHIANKIVICSISGVQECEQLKDAPPKQTPGTLSQT